jgi:BlaI family transcriptional regulator, penicillinase repressor
MVLIMKRRPDLLPRPTEAELELLAVLWDKGPATVRDLHEEIHTRRDIGYTSVLKLLQIMTEKGLVEREETARAHIYRAAASQKATQNQLLRDMSERLFAGSAAQMALHALALEPVGDRELEELRNLIEKKRKRP